MSLVFSSEIRTLNKLFPLTISRGTTAQSDNLFVFLSDGVHTGVGELSPATGKSWTAARGLEQLTSFVSASGLFDGEQPSPHEMWQAMYDAKIDPPAMAALDVALWDLIAKQADVPLHRLLGLPFRAVPTSVTIGINPAAITTERVPKILDLTGAKCLKIKLGSPNGIDYDKEHFLAAKAASAPYGSVLRVDANGGWSVEDAIHMTGWLAEHGVDYLEQPLVEGGEDGLAEVCAKSPLPVFIDESIKFASDVPKWATSVAGINLKLMKCGGVTEAMRIVATARAHGLKTMIGCMSESSVAIAAGVAMSALFDHIDLDSHLNLAPDPATGLLIESGIVQSRGTSGHGASLND